MALRQVPQLGRRRPAAAASRHLRPRRRCSAVRVRAADILLAPLADVACTLDHHVLSSLLADVLRHRFGLTRRPAFLVSAGGPADPSGGGPSDAVSRRAASSGSASTTWGAARPGGQARSQTAVIAGHPCGRRRSAHSRLSVAASRARTTARTRARMSDGQGPPSARGARARDEALLLPSLSALFRRADAGKQTPPEHEPRRLAEPVRLPPAGAASPIRPAATLTPPPAPSADADRARPAARRFSACR